MSADLFLPNVNRWLELGQYQQIKNVILDRAHTPKVREHGMDIILGVCNHLNSEKTVWSPATVVNISQHGRRRAEPPGRQTLMMAQSAGRWQQQQLVH
jgi:hypothetical protein